MVVDIALVYQQTLDDVLLWYDKNKICKGLVCGSECEITAQNHPKCFDKFS